MNRRTFVTSLLAASAVPMLAAAQASPRSVAPARIVFTNVGSASVVASWMDFGGAEVIYATIAPGESVTQDTYVGHVWRFRRGPGGPVITQWAVDRSRVLPITACPKPASQQWRSSPRSLPRHAPGLDCQRKARVSRFMSRMDWPISRPIRAVPICS